MEQLQKDIEYIEFLIDTERYYTLNKCHRILTAYRKANEELAKQQN